MNQLIVRQMDIQIQNQTIASSEKSLNINDLNSRKVALITGITGQVLLIFLSPNITFIAFIAFLLLQEK